MPAAKTARLHPCAPTLAAALARDLQQADWQLADHDACVELIVVDGTASAVELLRTAAASADVKATVLVCSEKGLEHLPELGPLPSTWVLLQWPTSCKWLDICIRRAVQLLAGSTAHLTSASDPIATLNAPAQDMSATRVDVAELQDVQQQLATTRMQLLDCLDAAKMYCWEWDVVTQERRTFGPSETILGIDAVSPAAACNLVHPADADVDENLWRAAILNNASYENTFRIVRPDGEIRWLNSRGHPVLDEHGQVLRFSGVAMDVTEQQRVGKELDFSSKRLQIALDAARLDPWSVDLLTGVHRHGPLELQLYGQSIKTAEQFESLAVTDDRVLVRQLRDPELLRCGKPIRKEFRITHPSGQLRWISCHAQVVPDENGVPSQLVGVSCDITDARNAQERLAQSLTRLDQVLVATKVMLWEWDRVRGLQLLHAAGPTDTQLRFSTIHRADRRRVFRCFRECLRSNAPMDLEFRLTTDDLNHRWVAVHGTRYMDDPVNGATLAGVMTDISARKRATDELALAQDRLARALVAAKMVCWDWSTDEPANLAPYSPSVSGGPPHQRDSVVHPEDREHHRQAIQRALTGPEGEYRCEFRIIRPGGGITWLLSIGRRVTDADGRATGMTGVAIDITAEKGTQFELIESREWQRLAATAGGLNLWRVDVTTGQRFGGELDLQLYESVPDHVDQVEALVSPVDRERVRATWRASIEQGTEFNLEYRIKPASGVVRWLRDRGKCLPSPHSGLPQIVGASLDITDQVRNEIALREALQHAEQASAAKSAFLAGMSHELRTPLSAVIGHSELLSKSVRDPLAMTQLKWLNAAATQLHSLVNNVLDFSRIEAAEVELERVSFNLLECLEPAIDMVAAEAERKALCLLMTSSGTQSHQVIGDPTRLRQIVLNLLANAVKFTEKGSVSLELLTTDETDNQVGVSIRVRDTGIGMNLEASTRLFQPFHQGDASMTRRFGGTGLGLSICRRLVDLMGGALTVRSTPDIGSCFELTLSLEHAADFARIKPAAGYHSGTAVDPGCNSRLPVLDQCHIGIAVMSDGMRSALVRQLAALGANSQCIEPGMLPTVLHSSGHRLDVLIIGRPVMETLRSIAPWPVRADGQLLPVVVLAGIDHSHRAWLGRQGERYLPISRSLKPRALCHALVEAIGDRRGGEAPVKAEPANSAAPYQHLRTLLAEDNQVNQMLLHLQLATFGIEPQLAGTGKEALEILARSSFDLIFMDVEMPEMDGMEATRQIRLRPEYQHCRPYVIAVTAHVLSESRERFLACGMNDYLSKPVLLDDLRAALDRALAELQRPGNRAS